MGYKDQQPTGNINEVSRIATGTVFKGEIESKSDIRIDGTFDGKINSTGRVVVGEGANVKGESAAMRISSAKWMAASMSKVFCRSNPPAW